MSPPVSATMTSAVRRPAPGNGDQPGDDGLERGGGGSDQPVQLGDLSGEVAVGVQVQTAHLRVRLGEPAVAGQLQLLGLAAQHAQRQVRQHASPMTSIVAGRLCGSIPDDHAHRFPPRLAR
jgi:hypothetical protein